VEPARGTDGNAVVMIDDGERLFEEKAAAIREARERVWIETFLFTPDETGRETLRLLCDAARRGCDVVLMFDQAGSHITNFGFYRKLEEAGGQVVIFNPLPLWRRYGRRIGSFFKHRNHRKTAVMDGVAFCGGHNFSQSYMGPGPQHFYDITVRLEGPCVSDVGALFLESMRQATGEQTRAISRPPYPAEVGGAQVRISAFDAHLGVKDLVRDYQEMVASAREQLTLIMGYFVPDDILIAPLIAAAERGVDVRVLTAGKSDLPFTRWAGQHRYDELLAAGVRIFQLQEPHLHAKCMVVDGRWSIVGSFDVNTFERRNTREAAVVIDDRAIAADLCRAFASCMGRSREVTPDSREQRLKVKRALEWVSYRAMRI
jgi:cardiolipin synthase A/B